MFAHNGDLPGLIHESDLAPRGFQPIGETDSEHAFCALLGRLAPCWHASHAVPSLECRLHEVAAFASALRRFGPANFLYADGDVLFAHGDRRFNTASGLVEAPGIQSLSRWCRGGERGFVTSGLSIDGADQTIALVASVPLTSDPWEPVAQGEVLAISMGRIVARRLTASC